MASCCWYCRMVFDELVDRHEERDGERGIQSAGASVAAAAVEVTGTICCPRAVLCLQCIGKAAAEVAEAGSCCLCIA